MASPTQDGDESFDVQTVPEYRDEILTLLLSTETQFMAKPGYMIDQKDINS